MVKDLLICFLVQTKKLKFFEAKLKNENIEYSKEKMIIGIILDLMKKILKS